MAKSAVTFPESESPIERCGDCKGKPMITYVCGEYFVVCKKCHQIGEMSSNQEKAIERWNQEQFTRGAES